MRPLTPPKPVGPRMLQRSSSGLSSGLALPGEMLPDPPPRLAPTANLRALPPPPLVPLTRATSATTGHRPSLTLSVTPGSSPYNASRSPEGPPAGRADAAAAAVAAATRSMFVGSPIAQSPGRVMGDQRTALPITPRSISKIVSLNDLRQLVRRMEAMPSPSPASGTSSSSAAVRANDNNNNNSNVSGNGIENREENGFGDDVAGATGAAVVAGGGGGARGSSPPWSDGVLDIVAVLGEGASGAVEAVQDKRTGRRFARKTIITHEGPLKQLVRELAFLSGLRHTNVVRFYGAYMSPSNSEVKLMMELCEGKSLAGIGEQIRRRKGRVGEKVARVLAEGVRCVFALSSLCVLSDWALHRSCKAWRTCTPGRSSIEISSLRTSSSQDRAWSSFATLAFPASSSAHLRARLPGRQSTWRCETVAPRFPHYALTYPWPNPSPNASWGRNTPSRRMYGRRGFPSSSSSKTVSPTQAISRPWTSSSTSQLARWAFLRSRPTPMLSCC